jgi:hypothetical protein
MLKVTLKFTVFLLLTALVSCTDATSKHTKEDTLRIADAASEKKIESAYAVITRECDSLLQFKVPLLVDSMLKHDSLKLTSLYDTGIAYNGQDEKAERIIRQLRADCDSSLLRETYKRFRQQQLLKPKRHIKPKA